MLLIIVENSNACQDIDTVLKLYMYSEYSGSTVMFTNVYGERH